MGRHRNKLQELSNVVSEENKKIAMDPASILTPGVDYSALDAQLADIERLGAPHPLSTSAVVPPQIAPAPANNMNLLNVQSVNNMNLINLHKEEPVLAAARHQAVNASLTGKMAMGPSFADLIARAAPNTQRDMVEQMQLKKEEIKIQESPIPLEEDLLNYLMNREGKSFGWVVDKSFLANFYIDPSKFEDEAKFIFWSTPVPINLKRVSITGFQRSEGTTRAISPMLFFLHFVIAEDKEAAFTKMINDPRYSELRTELDKRGINFVYHIDPRELLSSIENKIKIRTA